MEAEGERRGFPIVGRNVGVTLELLARSVGARRVVELGSGFGYSAYWFARAVGPEGELHCTDGDPENEAKAQAYLDARRPVGPVTLPRGRRRDVRSNATRRRVRRRSTTTSTRTATPTPGARRANAIRVGGLYVCDNVLWSGRVPADGEPPDERHRRDPRAQRD